MALPNDARTQLSLLEKNIQTHVKFCCALKKRMVSVKNEYVKCLKLRLLAIVAVACLIPSVVMAAGAPYNTYKGLQMYGYQGWFNAQGDGADKAWTHYSNGGRFEPGYVHIDYWPDVSEYTKKYTTPFKFSDGSSASVFSSYDESTVDTHFRWMKEYGQDGAFMQRFTHSIRDTKVKGHYMNVFDNAVKAATKYGRAISIRYDISSGGRDDYKDLLADLDELNTKYNFSVAPVPRPFCTITANP